MHFDILARCAALGLATALPAQLALDLPYPAPDLAGNALVTLGAPQDPPADKEPTWEGSLTLVALITTGNTKRRTANAGAEAKRRSGNHRTSLAVAWDYAQEKDDTSPDYELDQRHLQGSAKQDYFFTEKSYTFVSTGAKHDFDQDLQLRFDATAGLGLQLIEEEDMKFSIEAGAGYYLEQSRVTGAPDTDYLAGRISWTFDWKINERWHLINALQYFPSLEDKDELFGQLDTRLRATMGEGMFAQLQWIADYDNTPQIDAMGRPNDRVDMRFLLSIGWSF